MNNLDHISESLEKFFGAEILNFFDADPGWKKIGSGILDKHPVSATLEPHSTTLIFSNMLFF
jgi:hypothetical protein